MQLMVKLTVHLLITQLELASDLLGSDPRTSTRIVTTGSAWSYCHSGM